MGRAPRVVLCGKTRGPTVFTPAATDGSVRAAMKVTISHEFACDPQTFWDKLFFNAEYNQALYKTELQFPQYEVLEEKDEGSSIVRRVRVTPKQEAPAAIQKLVGGAFSYVEEGRFDKAAKRYTFKVVPGTLAEKIRSEGELRAEPVGPKRMRRVVDMTIEVKIFGVGGMVEGFVSKSTQDVYARAAAFTNRWIADKGL